MQFYLRLASCPMCYFKQMDAEPPRIVRTYQDAFGRTLAPLNPTGIIEIDGGRVPAQAESGWIDGDIEVEVVRDEAFGAVVRPRKKLS